MENNFISFLIESPNQFIPLDVKLEDGRVVNGYYVTWSNTVYLTPNTKYAQALSWRYRNN